MTTTTTTQKVNRYHPHPSANEETTLSHLRRPSSALPRSDAANNKAYVVVRPEEVLDAWFHGDYRTNRSRLWFAFNSDNQREADESFTLILKHIESDRKRY